jgi:hypothetical protein
MSRILIGLAGVWFFAGGFGWPASATCADASAFQRDCKPCKRPDGTLNQSPNVTDLVLDRLELRPKPLPPEQMTGEVVSSPDMMINIATNAVDAENDVLDYYYVVSAGRIVGSGPNVQWDLSGVPPGTYTITARVDDSCGVCGKTVTKGVIIIGKPVIAAATPVMAQPAKPVISTAAAPTVTSPKAATSVVIARPTPAAAIKATAAAAVSSAAGPCSCPTVLISDPERSGTDLIFTTKIFDSPSANRLTYIWTIVGGSVVSQDGRSIRIKPGVIGGTVKVSINGFDPKCSCPNRAEKSF